MPKYSSKHNAKKPEGEQKTNGIAAMFDRLIEYAKVIESSDWKMGWQTNQASWRGLPQNISGREYTGGNSFYLMMATMANNYSMPVFATFNQINKLNEHLMDDKGRIPKDKWDQAVHVNKGEQSEYAIFSTVQYKNTEDPKEKPLTREQYLQLPKEEREKYEEKWINYAHAIFNVDQTNMREVRPELYEKLKERMGIEQRENFLQDTKGMYAEPAIDYILQNQTWRCPVHFTAESHEAFYSPSKDEITIPKKEQFNIPYTEKDLERDIKKILEPAEKMKTVIHDFSEADRNLSNLRENKDNKEYKAELRATLMLEDTFGQHLGIFRQDGQTIKDYAQQINKAINDNRENIIALKDQEAKITGGKDYYATFVHEGAHSMGKELNINLNESGDKKGYAREELRAESSAAIIAATMGYGNSIFFNSAAYIRGWNETASVGEKTKQMKQLQADINSTVKRMGEIIDDAAIKAGQQPIFNKSLAEKQETSQNAAQTQAPQTQAPADLQSAGQKTGDFQSPTQTQAPQTQARADLKSDRNPTGDLPLGSAAFTPKGSKESPTQAPDQKAVEHVAVSQQQDAQAIPYPKQQTAHTDKVAETTPADLQPHVEKSPDQKAQGNDVNDLTALNDLKNPAPDKKTGESVAVTQQQPQAADQTLSPQQRLEAIGYPYSKKFKEDGSFNIPTVDESLYWRYAAGIITLKEAAREFATCGWTNFVDEDFTRRKFSELNIKYDKLSDDLEPLYAPKTTQTDQTDIAKNTDQQVSQQTTVAPTPNGQLAYPELLLEMMQQAKVSVLGLPDGVKIDHDNGVLTVDKYKEGIQHADFASLPKNEQDSLAWSATEILLDGLEKTLKRMADEAPEKINVDLPNGETVSLDEKGRLQNYDELTKLEKIGVINAFATYAEEFAKDLFNNATKNREDNKLFLEPNNWIQKETDGSLSIVLVKDNEINKTSLDNLNGLTQWSLVSFAVEQAQKIEQEQQAQLSWDKLSALLMDTNEDIHLKAKKDEILVLETDEDMGLSDLEKNRLSEVWQHPTEGIITFKMEGSNQEYDLSEYPEFVQQIIQHINEENMEMISVKQQLEDKLIALSQLTEQKMDGVGVEMSSKKNNSETLTPKEYAILWMTSIAENTTKDRPSDIVFVKDFDLASPGDIYTAYGKDADRLAEKISSSAVAMRPEIEGKRYPYADISGSRIDAVRADLMLNNVHPIIIDLEGNRIHNDKTLDYTKEERKAFLDSLKPETKQRENIADTLKQLGNPERIAIPHTGERPLPDHTLMIPQRFGYQEISLSEIIRSKEGTYKAGNREEGYYPITKMDTNNLFEVQQALQKVVANRPQNLVNDLLNQLQNGKAEVSRDNAEGRYIITINDKQGERNYPRGFKQFSVGQDMQDHLLLHNDQGGSRASIVKVNPETVQQLVNYAESKLGISQSQQQGMQKADQKAGQTASQQVTDTPSHNQGSIHNVRDFSVRNINGEWKLQATVNDRTLPTATISTQDVKDYRAGRMSQQALLTKTYGDRLNQKEDQTQHRGRGR